MSNREPKVHVIDGKTYVEVERKAEVGEKVLIVKAWLTNGRYDNGDIIVAEKTHENGIFNEKVRSKVNNPRGFIDDAEYRVLQPVKPTLAELCAKCTPENRHEEVFVDTSQASEQVIEMFAALSRKIVSLERQLADTQRNVERQAEELADTKYNAKKHIERLTCDIITLDERTQVINAITKFYEEARR